MTENLKINRIVFKGGAGSGSNPLDIQPSNVTVIVGPNNSGKSQMLLELENWCKGDDTESLVIDKVEIEFPETYENLRIMLSKYETKPPKNDRARLGYFWVALPKIRQDQSQLYENYSEISLLNSYESNIDHELRFYFVRLFTLRLDGRTRFDLVDEKETGPLDEPPKNHLWALVVNNEGRGKVREFTDEAFGKHFVIDGTGMQHFRMRLSNRKPQYPAEERAFTKKARDFHLKATLVNELGDGIRASIGLVSAVMSLPQRILLIDEPEAFLHPTLARRVGRVLAETALERDASLFTATHSADILYGCLQATHNLHIVRLTYSGNVATARSIDPSNVLNLLNDPLLRSANTLRALFYSSVVVTEADADRAFYEEVNFRLSQKGYGIEDVVFMNAQNWQTIQRIVLPLRKIGIPAAAIFDFDVLMEDDFKQIWKMLFTSKSKLRALQENRAKIKNLMKSKGKKELKKKGVNNFSQNEQEIIQQFLNKMAEFGIFFVPIGELECWLSYLNVGGSNDKPKWLTRVFEKLGSDPNDKCYVQPTNDDVWEFIKKVKSWVENENRFGIPQ